MRTNSSGESYLLGILFKQAIKLNTREGIPSVVSAFNGFEEPSFCIVTMSCHIQICLNGKLALCMDCYGISLAPFDREFKRRVASIYPNISDFKQCRLGTSRSGIPEDMQNRSITQTLEGCQCWEHPAWRTHWCDQALVSCHCRVLHCPFWGA